MKLRNSKRLQNISIKKYNTFGIDVTAKCFFACKSEKDLIEFLKYRDKSEKLFIIGGGSNLLFLNDFEGCVINMQNSGIDIVSEDNESVIISVKAGVVWDDFVSFCVENNFFGAENLSSIPGNIGACPVQNIGAYGVEAKDIIHEVKAVEINTCKSVKFSNSDCQFSYRNSIFKNKLKDKYIITKVLFKLSKIEKFNIEYGNIQSELQKYDKVNLKNIRQAIINIRTDKLPDYKEMPNAGSFFKNPIISKHKFNELIKEHPNLVSYIVGKDEVKLAAGQLIDMCGWKGKRDKNTGVHKNQALVIVNYGNATGKEILKFSEKIQESVYEKFEVKLEPEVIFIGN